jgi:hypothetical protein
MVTNEELKIHIERLEDRIRDLENKQKEKKIDKIIKKDIVSFYDILLVNKLLASLPVYTTARTGTPKDGEIYLTNISGTRKICAYIAGTEYCATLT